MVCQDALHQLHIHNTGVANKQKLLPPSSQGWRRYCFPRCVSVHRGKGVPLLTGPWSLVPGPFPGEWVPPGLLSHILSGGGREGGRERVPQSGPPPPGHGPGQGYPLPPLHPSPARTRGTPPPPTSQDQYRGTSPIPAWTRTWVPPSPSPVFTLEDFVFITMFITKG